MYGDVMSHRMQITLEDAQYVALSNESERTGASIAELVRQSISEQYRIETAAERSTRFSRALNGAAGVWNSQADDGLEYQRRLRASLQTRPVPEISAASGARRRASR